MRVTENMNFESSRNTIGRSRERMNRLQEQAASTKRLTTPSDDPVAAGKVLGIRTDKVNNDQFVMNSKIAETFLTHSEQALGEISDLIIRAKELAIGQSSGASANPQSRLAVAEEVGQLYSQAVAAAKQQPARDQPEHHGDMGERQAGIVGEGMQRRRSGPEPRRQQAGGVVGVVGLDLLVFDDLALLHVDQEHFSGL